MDGARPTMPHSLLGRCPSAGSRKCRTSGGANQESQGSSALPVTREQECARARQADESVDTVGRDGSSSRDVAWIQAGVMSGELETFHPGAQPTNHANHDPVLLASGWRTVVSLLHHPRTLCPTTRPIIQPILQMRSE